MIRRDFIKGSVAVAALGALSAVSAAPAAAAEAASAPIIQGKRMRARELGLSIGRYPCGKYNAIPDVAGVRVGHATVIKDGPGPVSGIARTGVSAIIPCDDVINHPLYAGMHSLNGNGEMTGSWWVEESGLLGSPIMLTNTHSVGVVRDTVIDYYCRKYPGALDWMLPVVAETWDGFLSDINGFHVRPEHVVAALDSAAAGPVAEGCVGGGTGMCCHEFKGGIGTSSRVNPADRGGYTVGVLVQGNYGKRHDLTIAGVPVGRYIPASRIPGKAEQERGERASKDTGSIIVVIATDAPISADQCRRLARRATLGLARTGGICGNGSGDIFAAFSTAHRFREETGRIYDIRTLGSDSLDELFRAVVEATHEAIVNAMCAAKTTSGIRGRVMHALPLDEVEAVMRRYGELNAALLADAGRGHVG